ncbi:major pollen allergen Ole e 10-like [Zingiber officinale]|uniref:major pollen allergen Ole e 10-like n=1 Tax=Zingiber officinale TaxID=94328 RepID=UPI001C4BE092|nr:major pollen allergen Ole e 10-like [Zingiber officinale]
MADAMRMVTSLLLLYFFLLPCLTNGSVALASTILSGKGPWCVARAEATREALQANIDYVCGFVGGACGAIQEGESCYSTDIVRQASYPMNAYFYYYGPTEMNCDFNGTGIIITFDPSHGNCVYPSRNMLD